MINITYSMHGKDPDYAADMLTVFPLKGDEIALEQIVTRLTKRLKSSYFKHGPELLMISSG